MSMTMDVRSRMKHPVHCVKPLDSIQHARELMEKHRINQLPVVAGGTLVGIITDRDVRDAFPSVFDTPPFAPRRAKITLTDPRTVAVETVMTRDVTTIGPADSITDAARAMRRHRIGALPVLEASRLVGILTRSDVLEEFIELTELEDVREGGRVFDLAPP
jgi:acetoin utilization protein AcuB